MQKNNQQEANMYSMGKESNSDDDENNQGSHDGNGGSYNYTLFSFFNRKFKIHAVEPPDDVEGAFAKYTGGEASHMSADQLKEFLAECQGHQDCTVEDADRLLHEVLNRRHSITKYARTKLNLDDFFHFIFSDDLNGPIRDQVHQDMSAPLSHYFIYTGHNSYLTGNQLSSDCSEVPIIKALQRGVRVIELDLWPGSTKDEIHVLHGRTLTTPVTLIQCLKAIKEYAFVASTYPVIITLEDHLTPDLQARVADMVTQTFEDMLYYPNSECLVEFPSPESLKNRIVISTKPPKEYLEDKGTASPPASEDEASEVDERKSDCEEIDADSVDTEHKSIQTDYKRLITIHAGKPSGALKDSLCVVDDNVKRLSLSEDELERAAISHGVEVVRFTQNNIVRVYPRGTRVTSSNYNPMTGWIHGAQMIAFNMQGYGKSLWLMHGMFRANGGSGYVKKPDFLMQTGDDIFDPKRTQSVQKVLKVKVYLGDGWRLDFSHTHFDTYSPPDFYTKLYIVGLPVDCAKVRTRVIGDDWCPVWNEEFTFPLAAPDLALLRIEVGEYDVSDTDDFGGQTCLPVAELRPGIRTVPLYDRKGTKFNNVRLLMKFEFSVDE